LRAVEYDDAPRNRERQRTVPAGLEAKWKQLLFRAPTALAGGPTLAFAL
jgi:hypothetical protein